MAEKEKKKGGLLYKLVMLVLIGIIVFCLYQVGTILYGYHKGDKQYNQVQQVAGTDQAEKFTGDVDFESLKEQNADVRAWIYSEGTVINYPVVQGPDNDYYLYRMFNGEYNGAGSIFIDYRHENPFEDFNTIIYGHRMKDGSMFKSLIEYRDADYYNAHKTMLLTTPDAKYDVHIFSVVTIPADSDLYQLEFADDAEKQAYLDRIIEESETKMDVSVSPSDNIVMMSTCTFEIDDGRLCVYGKLVERAGE